jgi:hypothetical protein
VKRGPKFKAPEPLVTSSFRATPAQLDKLNRLGGGAWLRMQIDAAKEPKK